MVKVILSRILEKNTAKEIRKTLNNISTKGGKKLMAMLSKIYTKQW